MATIKDDVLKQFSESLPCKDCDFADICKYPGSINPPTGELPKIFEVKYVCTKKQEKLTK